MELGLSLGDSPAPARPPHRPDQSFAPEEGGEVLVLELGVGFGRGGEGNQEEGKEEDYMMQVVEEEMEERSSPDQPPVELGLRPLHLPHSPYSTTGDYINSGFDVNTVPAEDEAATTTEGRPLSPPANSTASSLQMELSARRTGAEDSTADDEENGGGGARKKLRLSKQQSAFLEESFKEHSTLNPKQKLALAKQLNLRPRQVEVWFQNRRARTKLKQTEVDCEYLKRCCETLTHENRRLQREVAELRASFRTIPPFYSTHVSATTTMSVRPACERVPLAATPPSATSTSSTVTVASAPNGAPPSISALFAKSRFPPFAIQPVLRRRPSATSS